MRGTHFGRHATCTILLLLLLLIIIIIITFAATALRHIQRPYVHNGSGTYIRTSAYSLVDNEVVLWRTERVLERRGVAAPSKHHQVAKVRQEADAKEELIVQGHLVRIDGDEAGKGVVRERQACPDVAKTNYRLDHGRRVQLQALRLKWT